jgi:uncharacterized protein (TIGR02117 family)
MVPISTPHDPASEPDLPPGGSAPEDRADGASRPPGVWRRLQRVVVRCVLAFLGFVGLYLLMAELVMRIPVHSDADPDGGEVDIYLVSNGVHVAVWLPTARPERDWSSWLPEEVPAQPGGYVEFSWGDHDFYLEVPTWDDLTAGVALRGALLPTRSVMRASVYRDPPDQSELVHRVSIEPDRYRDLIEFVDHGFRLDDDGHPILLAAPGYGFSDRFFEGRESYHLFRTCNTWANGAVKAMGQRAALWTPFERGARHHLPRNQGEDRK